MDLKASKFNVFLKEAANAYLGFNTFTGNRVRMTTEMYQLIRHILKMKHHSETNSLVVNLLEKGFLVDAGADEFALVRDKYWRFSQEKKGYLTIALTLDCNFRCIYCFEGSQEHRPSMSDTCCDRLLAFVSQFIKPLNELTIDWYGGEPLIETNRLIALDAAIQKICAMHDCRYTSSISTNGYLLTRELALQLSRRTGVSLVRVCLDGPPACHDRSRPMRNGSGSFHAIVENLVCTQDLLDLKLRLNVTRSNAGRIAELIDILLKKGMSPNRAAFSLKPVISSRESPCENETIGVKDFYRVFSRIRSMLRSCGFEVDQRTPAVGARCIVCSDYQYMVDWDGNLFKCSDNFDLGEAVGKINERGGIEKGPIEASLWTHYFPDQDINCRKCKVLPLCLGGCNFLRLIRAQNCCIPEKYDLRRFVIDQCENDSIEVLPDGH